MVYHLFIKGNGEQAEKALLEHGLDPSERLTHPMTRDTAIPAYPVTDVIVAGDNQQVIEYWMKETSENFDREPFPPGTLLNYIVKRG